VFGYIRPLQGQLKVCELERFKACYCGMCHALGKNYGLLTRFTLSYEFVFLAMLFWGGEETPIIKRGRCIASPFRRKKYCAQNETLDVCAGYSVILTWWKLKDAILDEPFFKAIPQRFIKLVLSGAYRKASREFAEFDGKARDGISSLEQYEAPYKRRLKVWQETQRDRLEGAKGDRQEDAQGDAKEEQSLDGAADKFAQILCAAASGDMPVSTRRPMLELLYHLGRWIYIVDAVDDYAADVKTGRYNAIAALYPPREGKLPEESGQRLKTTLAHSNNLLCAAFELLPDNPWTTTVGNMVYLGMPDVCQQVFDRVGNK